MSKIKVKVMCGGKIPEYMHPDDACADCYARIREGVMVIPRGQRALVPLGVCLEIPFGYEAVVRPRSGNTKKGIDVGIGTIDSGFRGEVQACVINSSREDFIIRNGDRICQLKIQQAEPFEFEEVEELSVTERASNGFGSTGV